MPHVDVDAGARELTDIAGGLEVGTRDGEPTLMENQGNAAHAGTADADKVSALEHRGGRRLGNCNGRHDSPRMIAYVN